MKLCVGIKFRFELNLGNVEMSSKFHRVPAARMARLF